MAPSIVQRKFSEFGTNGATFDAPLSDAANLVVSIGVYRGNGLPTPAGGWTLLASAFAANDYGNHGDEGIAFCYAVVAGSTSAGPWAGPSGSLAEFYEIAGADLADVVAISLANQNPAGTTATMDIGTLTDAPSGVALMAETVTRATDQAAQSGAFAMGSDWTEIIDRYIDSGQQHPWVGVGEATLAGSSPDPSWDYTELAGGQSIGEWAGIALLFPGLSPLVCAFSGTPTSGLDPLTVEFTDETTGSPDTWLWDFGDGDTSTEQNPTHVYTEPGTYTVTLTASRGGDDPDECSHTITDYIHVTAANAWDIYAADALTGPLIATLENAKGRWIRSELHGLGEGGFTINRHAAEATEDNLAEGNMVKVRIRECGPDYIDGFFLGDDGDYTLLSPQREAGGENLVIHGLGALSYLDRARMLPCSFSLEDSIGTWTKIWATTSVNRPVGVAFDAAMSGYVFVGGLGSRKVKKLDQATRAVVASSAALWSGTDRAMGGISLDPDDDTIMWILEAPWLLGSGANTKIRKYQRAASGLPTTLLDTYDLGSAVKLTDIRVDGDYVWTSRYDNDRIQKRDKSDPTSIVASSTITYKGKVQRKPNGIAINGTKVAYWFGGDAGGGTGRALIADTSAYTTITGVQNTTNVSAFGGEWTTEGGDDFLYAVSYTLGKTWKYQLTDAIPRCADDSGTFHPDQVAPGAIAWRVLVEITHPDRPVHECPELSFDFTETEDSNGTPWPARTSTEEFTWRVGDRAYSDLLARLIPSGVTLDLDVNTMTLHAYVDADFGTDRTSATFAAGKVRFEEAVNLAVNGDLSRRDNRGQPATYMTVAGDGGVYGDATLAGRYVRSGFMQVTGPTTEAVLDAIGDDELARERLIADALGFETLWAVETEDQTFDDLELLGRYVPKRHYWKGDLVRVDMTAGEFAYDETDFRVYGTLIEERDGKPVEEGEPPEPGWRSVLDLGSAYKVPPPIESVPGDSSGSSSGGGASSGGTTVVTSIPLTVENEDGSVVIPRVTKIIADGVTSPASGTAVIPTGDITTGPDLSDDTPLIEAGAGDPGDSDDASRADHVHPAATADAMVPYYIPSGQTFTVPLYKQALYTHAITIDGALVVDGILEYVS